jgi:hypothetical protein
MNALVLFLSFGVQTFKFAVFIQMPHILLKASV